MRLATLLPTFPAWACVSWSSRRSRRASSCLPRGGMRVARVAYAGLRGHGELPAERVRPTWRARPHVPATGVADNNMHARRSNIGVETRHIGGSVDNKTDSKLRKNRGEPVATGQHDEGRFRYLDAETADRDGRERRVRNLDPTFVAQAGTLTLVSPSGLGKTMLAIGIATKQVQLGATARFITAQRLASQLGRTTTPIGRQRLLKPLLSCDVLVRDDLGYLDGAGLRPSTLRTGRRTLRTSPDHHHLTYEADRMGEPSPGCLAGRGADRSAAGPWPGLLLEGTIVKNQGSPGQRGDR